MPDFFERSSFHGDRLSPGQSLPISQDELRVLVFPNVNGTFFSVVQPRRVDEVLERRGDFFLPAGTGTSFLYIARSRFHKAFRVFGPKPFPLFVQETPFLTKGFRLSPPVCYAR